MKPVYGRLALVLCLIAALLGGGATISAITIDFDAVPDGTAASAHNPYNGILEIRANEIAYFVDADHNPNGNSQRSASIRNGSLQVFPDIAAPSGSSVNWCMSELTATFLQPVASVSFDAWCYRASEYSYSGLNKDSVSFSGQGTIWGSLSQPDPVTFALSIPEGGYLTSFSIQNSDSRPGQAAFWVDNISFQPVPEPSIAVFSGAFLASLIGWHRIRPGKRSKAG